MRTWSRTLSFAGSLALAAAGFSGKSSAAVVLSDNFDAYADQAAFQAAWPVVGAQPSATLSTAQAVSPTKSVNVSAGAATATSQRNERSFAETGTATATDIITFSFDFFDANAALAPFRQYANLQDSAAPSGNGQLISLGLNNNLTGAQEGGNFYMARVLGGNSNGGTAGAYFKLNDNPALLRTTGWHNLSVRISDVDLKFFVDGTLAETMPALAPLRSYDLVRLGAGVSSTSEAFFDNVLVSVTQIPEPSTIALGLIAGLGLLRRRRPWG